MMLSRNLLFPLAALFLIGSGSGWAQEQAPKTDPKDQVLATVNGTPLTAEMLAFYTQRRLADGSARHDEAGRVPNLMSDLISLEVMAQQAQEQGLQNDASLQMIVKLTLKNLLAQNLMQAYLRDNPPQESEMRDAYDLIKARVYGAQYHVFHIQVEEEAKARELIAQLKDGAEFAELAKAHSLDPTGASGGELGWFAKGQLPAEFAASVEAAQPGTNAEEPVKSDHGWHVVRLEAVREQPAPSFEESRETLEGLVRNQRLQAYVNHLRADAEITAPR